MRKIEVKPCIRLKATENFQPKKAYAVFANGNFVQLYYDKQLATNYAKRLQNSTADYFRFHSEHATRRTMPDSKLSVHDYFIKTFKFIENEASSNI